MSFITMCTTVARGILHERALRRKMMMQLGIVLICLTAAGLYWIDSWLAMSPWRFAIFWLAVLAYTSLLLLFCLYDMLRVIREEHDEENS